MAAPADTGRQWLLRYKADGLDVFRRMSDLDNALGTFRLLAAMATVPAGPCRYTDIRLSGPHGDGEPGDAA